MKSMLVFHLLHLKRNPSELNVIQVKKIIAIIMVHQQSMTNQDREKTQ
jgi:hypothetical protein